MQTPLTAHDELQALLGAAATDDDHWHDLRRFEHAALPIIATLWSLTPVEAMHPWALLNPHDEVGMERNRQRTQTAVMQVNVALGVDTSRCAAAFYFSPQLWQPAYTGRHQYDYSHPGYLQRHLLQQVATAVLANATPPDWPQRVANWIRTLCLASNVEQTPHLATCFNHLLTHDTGIVADVLDAITLSEWQRAWSALAALAQDTTDTATPEQLAKLWHLHGASVVVAALARLHCHGRLDTAAFRTVVTTVPRSLKTISAALYAHASGSDTPLPSAFRTVLQGLLDVVVWELLCDLRPETWPTLAQLGALSGGRVLLRIVEEIARHDLATVHVHYRHHNQLAGLLGQLLSVTQRRDDDDSAALTVLLNQLPPTALLAALPHTVAYTPELCAALDWSGAATLVTLVRRVEHGQTVYTPDPTFGVVSHREVRALIELMNESHAQTLLEAFAPTCSAAVLLIRAALGSNRTEVRRQFGRRSQLAARAMGLLPLEKSDELLSRYLALRRYERESNTSSAGRKAFERAAAQAGLANLADQSGYADATRLEWAMEDKLGNEAVAIGQQWMIEGYTLTLALRDGSPILEVRSPKRLLKRVPTLVSRDYIYREVRAARDGAQDQQRRYRQALLNAMRSGGIVSRDELLLLRRNPVAAALLERLVFIDVAGAVGFFRSEDMSLEGVYGERMLIGASVTVAHALTLADLGVLADWQLAVVRNHVVQPFTQVFREIYRVTPAELASGYSSARLAGRQMKGRQAMAVLANMGWSVDGYGGVRKPFYDLRCAATFEAGEFDGYNNTDDRTITGAVAFWPLVFTHTRSEARLRLADIPPLVFSEVLRDLDLVTVIAHQSDEHGTSQEVLHGRSELVVAVANMLGMGSQVAVALPHVLVQGTRASYRIHLATGAIYLENGQYLCIVPSPKERAAIYLPYADGGELLGSEIISKVVQLVGDATITDPTILAQLPNQHQVA